MAERGAWPFCTTRPPVPTNGVGHEYLDMGEVKTESADELLAKVEILEKQLYPIYVDLAKLKLIAEKLNLGAAGVQSQAILRSRSLPPVQASRPVLPAGYLQEELRPIELMAAEVRQRSFLDTEQFAETLSEFVLCVRHSAARIQRDVLAELREGGGGGAQSVRLDSSAVRREASPGPPPGGSPDVASRQELINQSLNAKIRASSVHSSMFALKCFCQAMKKDDAEKVLKVMTKKHDKLLEEVASLHAKIGAEDLPAIDESMPPDSLLTSRPLASPKGPPQQLGLMGR
eukprot:TRINITY_DN81451_c0_g1_i1.p1 TRINITY_DN81451_c0_g1~~TRINITY_DN81451_c0_g1_i1.p1  ORF type:complete len:288 (+),score=64.06 TRINITY_DN81451_c0_g1_i1:46-909(+)